MTLRSLDPRHHFMDASLTLPTTIRQAATMRHVKLTRWESCKIWFKTLFYNHSFSFYYAMDTLAEPVFWFVDHFTSFLGRFFVCMVYVLVSLVVAAAYFIGLPIYWKRSEVLTVILIIVGKWILVNILFNYTQAVRTSPGRPIDSSHLLAKTTVNVCKKCIHPKPPRAHHCSICNRCYLKMDHHCPWMNNCIGHNNHRYFFLTLVYFVVGCFFIIVFGVDLAFRQVVQGEDVLPFKIINNRTAEETVLDEMEKQVSGPFTSYVFPVPAFILIPLSKAFFPEGNERAELLFGVLITRSQLLLLVYVISSLCVGTCFALAGLGIWHGKLVSRGETSIEYHINKNGVLQLGEKYVNQYDLGVRRNWEVFLGLDRRPRTIWRHLLLPSTHPPSGDGYDWSNLSKHDYYVKDM